MLRHSRRYIDLCQTAAQRSDGLWIGSATLLPDDEPQRPSAELLSSVHALSNAIATLKEQGAEPFNTPHRLDDAGWVANRWCEILPISSAAKQRLMVLDEPVLRLKLVQEYLQGKGVV